MSSRTCSPEITWPDLDSSYTDEFGRIDRTIYEIARKIWPLVVPSILRLLRDLQAGQAVMMKAAALVSRKLSEDPQKITNLHGYLYRTFIHLLKEKAEKEGRHAELNRAMLLKSEASAKRSDEAIYEIILIHQLLKRADPDTRAALELRLIGHTFEEIAKWRGMNSNHLRSEWSKEIRRLALSCMQERRALLSVSGSWPTNQRRN
jgi:DNA-directed RNA polymerase specialized sigma24 family protein